MNVVSFNFMFKTSHYVIYKAVELKNVICRTLLFSKSNSRNENIHYNIDKYSLHERWKTAKDIVIFLKASDVGIKFK